MGRYRIERELGRGGMGVVYLAEDTNTGRKIALKTTAVAGLGTAEKSRNQRRQRFVREVQALTQVNHDNVVHVMDAGDADDPDLGLLLFYTMEYVEGETLAQLVQRLGPLPPGSAAAVCTQVAAGLGAAHDRGIVHRDVKPANIFISLDGHALIGDFGICKIEGSTQITRRDQLVGTPNYLAPEQILGDPVSPATDVFALGALFYVVTMNRPLRDRVDAAALLTSAQTNEPKERMLGERAIPDGLRKVIARCLEKDPKKRWQTGAALADALAEYATRVPTLRDETMSDPKRDAGTTSADRSSPFASLPSGEGQELPFANPNDVEAAARALMAEVEGRSVGKPKEPARDAPLPVARTESTVMFNLRAMEAQQAADTKKPLPVARTEPTVVFRARGLGAEDGAQANRLDLTSAAELTPASDLSDGDLLDRDTAGGDTDTERSSQVAVRVVGETKAKRSRRTISLPRLPALPKLSRGVQLALTGAAGALIGVVLVAILAPSQPALSHQPEPGKRPGASVLPTRRPAICPADQQVTEKDAVQAKNLLRRAREARSAGGTPSQIRADVEKSTQLNPFDHEAFDLYAQILGADETERRRDVYACVCFISAASNECRAAKAFLARLNGEGK
ncbi:MAG: hypothetical protein A2138_10070 [Deltaproteobacteria bacterium RBG_16_71_12]|nr:MAG: hypothetical protein A2138_10070 [Deltaproteobacteria bacterium RBG_16_71_12]